MNPMKYQVAVDFPLRGGLLRSGTTVMKVFWIVTSHSQTSDWLSLSMEAVPSVAAFLARRAAAATAWFAFAKVSFPSLSAGSCLLWTRTAALRPAITADAAMRAAAALAAAPWSSMASKRLRKVCRAGPWRNLQKAAQESRASKHMFFKLGIQCMAMSNIGLWAPCLLELEVLPGWWS